MLAEIKPANGQDSFLDALHSEIIAGSENLNAWINQVRAQGAIDSLFCLETWLKGIRSFFSLDHLPLSELEKAGLVSRSFTPEIEIIRLAVQICEAHAYEVIGPENAGEFEFDEFIEVQLRRDRILDFHISRMVEQLTPRDSLSQLMEFLNDLRVTIDAVKDKPSLSYQFFLSLGRSFGRELKNCRYIDMLLSQRFRLQYDLVENQTLTEVLREIPDDAVRRNVALTLLYLFRLLKYLKLISADLGRDLPLKQNLVLFSLIHKEMGSLADFLEARFLKGRECGEDLRNATELIAYSQKIESQRVLSRELIFVAGDAEPSNVYTRVENTHGLLRNCCQSCVLTLLQAIDRDFDAASLFPSRARRLLSTEKLRQDLWDLRQWLTDMLGNREELDANKIIERLTSFKEASLSDLMHRDWAEFDSFLDALIISGNFIEIRTHMRKFVSFLEMLIQEISKRSVFQEKAAKS
jgi:hypothetical protein